MMEDFQRTDMRLHGGGSSMMEGFQRTMIWWLRGRQQHDGGIFSGLISCVVMAAAAMERYGED